MMRYDAKLITPVADMMRLHLKVASASDQPNSSITIGVPKLEWEIFFLELVRLHGMFFFQFRNFKKDLMV